MSTAVLGPTANAWGKPAPWDDRPTDEGWAKQAGFEDDPYDGSKKKDGEESKSSKQSTSWGWGQSTESSWKAKPGETETWGSSSASGWSSGWGAPSTSGWSSGWGAGSDTTWGSSWSKVPGQKYSWEDEPSSSTDSTAKGKGKEERHHEQDVDQQRQQAKLDRELDDLARDFSGETKSEDMKQEADGGRKDLGDGMSNDALDSTKQNQSSPLFSPVASPNSNGWQPQSLLQPPTSTSFFPSVASTSSASFSQPQYTSSPPAAALPPWDHFRTLPDGSSMYRPCPTTYDIREMWEGSYSYPRPFMKIEFYEAGDMGPLEQALDTNIERYYWDMRYETERPSPSPYVQEIETMDWYNQKFFCDRLAHLDFMFSRVDRSNYPQVKHDPSDLIVAPTTQDFVDQNDREVKRLVYKGLRMVYDKWNPGEAFPSVLDWEGDHTMPYRVGEMVY